MKPSLFRCLAIVIVLPAFAGRANAQVMHGAPERRALTVFIRDTANRPLPGVEVSIIDSSVRALSDSDGRLRLLLPEGTYNLRARRLGYQATSFAAVMQGDTVSVMVRLRRSAVQLAPLIVSAHRIGIEGIIVDSTGAPIPSALVTVFAKSRTALTDSAGRYFVEVPTGSYMMSARKDGFEERVVGVNVPDESAKEVSLELDAQPRDRNTRHAWNIPDLNSRLAGRNRQREPFLTRDDILRIGYHSVLDAVRMAGAAQYSDACVAVKNGGPETVALADVTIEQVEAMEIYNSAMAGGPTNPSRGAARGVLGRRTNSSSTIGNERTALFENQGLFCPLVYLWLR